MSVADVPARETDAPLRVALGAHVEVELVDDMGAAERPAFGMVSDSEAEIAQGFLGVGTPLARAICGQAAGSIAKELQHGMPPQGYHRSL